MASETGPTPHRLAHVPDAEDSALGPSTKVTPEASTLMQAIQAEPYRFDFFQAVRKLENANAELARPGKPRVGHSQHVKDDPVRFGQDASLAFAPSTLSRFLAARGDRPARMYVNFFGLMGPNGPLPLHLTEYIRSRGRNQGDWTLPRFMNMLQHRMVSLFYRAWATAQQTVQFERGDEDRYAVYVGSSFGIGMPGFRRRDAVPDVAKLHYSGRLVGQTRHPEGLRAMLEDFFKIKVEIEEFVGSWIELPSENQCRLGESPDTGSVGHTAIVGSRVWNCQQRFRIKFGPMSFADYQRMLPTGDSLKRLVGWVKNYLGDELLWDLQLILKREEVPSSQLGGLGQLGWTTWVRKGEATRDADDLVLQPQSLY